MKLFLLVLILFSGVNYATSKSAVPQNAGVTGRYCSKGSYNINTGHLSNYQESHYCGLHPIDVPMCVSIAYANNMTDMDCDNAGGIFPKCTTTGCYYQGNLKICCCDSDECNDCSQYPSWCLNPLSELTPTTTTTTTTTTDTNSNNNGGGNQTDPNPTDTTTTKSSASSLKISVEIFIFSFVVFCVIGFL